MCTRSEINGLIGLLLYHVDRAAAKGAEIQLKQEQRQWPRQYEQMQVKEQQKQQKQKIIRRSYKQRKSGKSTAIDLRMKQLLRFHSAYFRYLIFASDPYTELLIPLSTSSSLTLFITNFIRRQMPYNQAPYQYTSRVIVEFLQVNSIVFFFYYIALLLVSSST